MAQTLTRLLVHIVFSTKGRADLITPKMELEIYRYIGCVCRGASSPLLDAGGTANHVHLLVSLSKNIALAELLLQIKRDSTRWIKSNHAKNFRWQEGYGAFSIGESARASTGRYFARQKQHHKKESFEDELRNFLRLYKMEWEEEYVFD